MTIAVKDANSATQTISTIDDQIAIIGQKTDAANTATDGTAVTAISIFKQISKTLQGAAASAAGRIYAQLSDGTNSPAIKAASSAPAAADPALTVALSPNGGQATAANQTAPSTASVTNPSSQLSLPATTTQYGVNTIAANGAAPVTVPSFAIPNSAGAFKMQRARLYSDDQLSTAWTGQTVQVDLWSSAPTFTNGDRGAYAVATGAANYLGSLTGTFKELAGDGSYAILVLADGSEAAIKLAAGASVYWTVKCLTGTSGVTTASKHLTFVPELTN